MDLLFQREKRMLAPGAVHVPDWLTIEQQRRIVEAARGWAAGPARMRKLSLGPGRQMSVQTVCLGWQWLPHRYTRIAEDLGNVPVEPLPEWLVELGREAVRDAYDDPAAGDDYHPDVALVNFYDDAAKLGMHQDKDEKNDAPVVSLSIGDTCTFRFGNTENRNKPYTDVELMSGDLFVFGGPSRFAYHGVPKVRPGSANPETGMKRGRLNISLRTTGLE